MINQLTFTKHYDTFDNVSKIYSDKFPQGKDLELLHIVLYFRFLSYQENNLNCYESHETLAKIFKSSASTIKRKINDLKEMGLLETSPHPDPYISSLIYNALPLTDGKRLVRTVLIFTESSDQLSRATDRVPGLPASPGYVQ